jgi:hypothetical protein
MGQPMEGSMLPDINLGGIRIVVKRNFCVRESLVRVPTVTAVDKGH